MNGIGGVTELVSELKLAGSELAQHLETRAALLGVEMQQALVHAQEVGRVAVAGAVAGVLLLVQLNVAILVWCWDTPYRRAAALALVVLYATLSVGAWVRLRQLGASGGSRFNGTRSELQRDLAMLREYLS